MAESAESELKRFDIELLIVHPTMDPAQKSPRRSA
jgi:hypothetical protein